MTRQKACMSICRSPITAVVLSQVLPERYGGQAPLVSIANAVAARRAGEAAAAAQLAQANEVAQAAGAAASRRPVTGRLAAAGSTVKR